MVLKNNFSLNKRSIALCVFIVFSLLHLAVVVINHYNFKTFAFDYGVYNFAFFDFAHFRVDYCPVYLTREPVSFLQDHFSLTLIFLSPLYWVLSPVLGTYTLLVLQWLLICAGGWATYKFIFLKANNYLTATAAMACYFSLYGRFGSYQSDCNLVIMGAAVLPVFLYFFEKRNRAGMWISFVFLLCNREDFPLDLAFLCLVLFLIHRQDKAQRRLAAVLGFLSLLAFVLIFKIFIPLLEDEHRKFSLFNYSALGATPGEALVFMLSHPLKTLALLFINQTGNPTADGIKTEFYLVYFISGGFLLLFRPVYLLAFIPLVFKKMFNDDPLRWGNDMYQSVEVASLLPVLVFSVIAEMKSVVVRNAAIAATCVFTCVVTVYFLRLSTERAFGFNKVNFLSASFYVSDYNTREVNRVMKKIPDTASVCASGRLLPHLAFRKRIFHFPYVDESDYVVVHKTGHTFPLSQEEFNSRLNVMQTDGEWTVVEETPELLLLKRR